MRFLHAIVLLVSLLAVTGTAGAQSVPEKGRWSGHVSLTAGANHKMPEGDNHEFLDTLTHISQSAEVLLKYDRRKFGAALLAKQGIDRKNTDGNKMTYTQQDLDSFSQLDVMTRKAKTAMERYDVRTDLRWTPSDRTRLTGYVLGSFQRDTATNATFNMILMEDRFSIMTEEVDEKRNAFGTGIRGELRFDKRRSLTGSLEWRRDWNGKKSHWYGDEFGPTPVHRSYRLTPGSTKDHYSASFFYRDSSFAGVSGLLFEPGLRLSLTRDDDHYSGATQRPDGFWQDSLSLREHYDFVTATVEPYVRADYKKENLSAYLEAGLQLYGTRLDNDTLHQAMAMHPVKPVGRLGGRWQISPQHAVFCSGSLAVQRPTYQNICWYPRQGPYPDQLFIGNPDLRPTQLVGSQMGYRFQYKHFFAEYTSSYSRRDNEVVRTFSNSEKDGKTMKVFTWINAARTRTWIEKATLGWDGTVVKANVFGLYHDLRQKQDPTDKVEENRYWELGGNLQLLLPYQWTLTADANYHTRIKTLFQIIDPYLRLNARVQKKFGSAWTLFLEGKDLMDKPVRNGIISGFTKETWMEETRQNRRILQLGVTWQF